MTLAGTADAEYRDCSCPGAERQAESLATEANPARTPHELMPNPSLKRSANGRPPGPDYGEDNSPQPGPGALPLSPA
jgi:hypothetical protein